MSTKKKKNLVSQCARCNCYFLNRDLETHPENCEIDSGTSHIRPHSTFVGTSCKIEKRETHLPSDSIGWTKNHTVLVNPYLLEMLEILPRTPCILNIDSTCRRIVVVWPCSEVSLMKISVQGLTPERTVRLDVVKQFKELKSLQLSLNEDVDERLLSADHFINYVKVYLSCGFVSPELPLDVKYLARTFYFNVSEDNADRLERLKLGSNLPVVYNLTHDFNLSFIENFR